MTKIAAALAVAVAWTACSSSASAPVALPDAAGTGGTVDATTGGHPSTGGTVATGGTAGAPTGGQPSTGGTVATGGAAGAPTGGTVGRGGSQGTGGQLGLGGTTLGKGGSAGSSGGAIGTGGGTDAGIDAREAGGSDLGRDGPASDTRPAIADAPAPAAETNTSTVVTIYIAGDSTVSTYTNSAIHQGGWGQFLQDNFIANAKIVNKAVGGMTARHFIEAGYLDQILAVIKAGDYLLVQFGTNDSNKTATYTLTGSSTEIPYYLDAQPDFKTYLAKYVDGAKAKGATTIFVTPPPRHTCNAGETGVRNGLSAYAAAMSELGPTLGTLVVDSNAMIIDYLANVTCETSGSTFYLVKADGTTDGTHFQENGAKIIAGLIAKGKTGLSTLNLPLSAYVK